MRGTGDAGARLYSTNHRGLEGGRHIAVCNVGSWIFRSEHVLVGIEWLSLKPRKKELFLDRGVLSWAGGNTP